MLRIQQSFSWSVLTAKRVPSKYGRSSVTAEWTARHSLSIVVNSGFLLAGVWEQYPTNCIFSSSVSCSNAQPICITQTSVSSVCFLSLLGQSEICRLIKQLFNTSRTAHSSLSKSSELFGWSLFSFLLSSTANSSKFGTNRLKTLQRSRHERSFV